MICGSCGYAGDLLSSPEVSTAKVEELHAKCPEGTWCDCQHVIAVPGTMVRKSA